MKPISELISSLSLDCSAFSSEGEIRMLDMGFADAIKKINETIEKHLPEKKDFQRVLLSATPTTGSLTILDDDHLSM